MVSSPPNQNSPVTLSAMSQRKEMPYSPHEHDLAKEHPCGYQKDFFGHRVDPKESGYLRTGLLNLATTDISGGIIVRGCPVHCRMLSDVPKAPGHAKFLRKLVQPSTFPAFRIAPDCPVLHT